MMHFRGALSAVDPRLCKGLFMMGAAVTAADLTPVKTIVMHTSGRAATWQRSTNAAENVTTWVDDVSGLVYLRFGAPLRTYDVSGPVPSLCTVGYDGTSAWARDYISLLQVWGIVPYDATHTRAVTFGSFPTDMVLVIVYCTVPSRGSGVTLAEYKTPGGMQVTVRTA
jgi:hypothetical protein